MLKYKIMYLADFVFDKLLIAAIQVYLVELVESKVVEEF